MTLHGAGARLKKKVANCENITGTHIALNDPVISEILGHIGFDFIWMDTEHTALDYQELQRHISCAQAGGTAALVRVHENDRNHVKRVLEMGPDGVIFPMINTAEAAEAAMHSCLYPPHGNRGFGPLRAVRYGIDDVDRYIDDFHRTFCRFIQIESETAIRNLPEIVKNPWIDGFIFGPCDLSGSIERLNQVFCAENITLIKEAIAILQENRKCIGISTGSSDPETLRFWCDLGINMVSAGVDYGYIVTGAQTVLSSLNLNLNKGVTGE